MRTRFRECPRPLAINNRLLRQRWAAYSPFSAASLGRTLFDIGGLKMKLELRFFALASLVTSTSFASEGYRPLEQLAPNDGLTAEDRQKLYHTAEGSEGLPLAWMLALTSVATGKPFLEEPERFGLLPDPKDPLGFPVGWAASVPRDLKFAKLMMSGVTCAACHVGEVRYGGKALRLVGGASFFNAHKLQTDLVKSIVDTLTHPKKFFAFMSRANAISRKLEKRAAFASEQGDDVEGVVEELSIYEKGSGEEALGEHIVQKGAVPSDEALSASVKKLKSTKLRKKTVAQVFKELKEALKIAASTISILNERIKLLEFNSALGAANVTDAGAGRVDAFGTLMYRFFRDKSHLPNAPVSYPQLYNIATTTWYHYDGNTSMITERNIGNAIGLGVVWDPKSSATTLMPRSVHTLESVFWKSKAPKWPEAMLGKLDTNKVRRGEAIFNAECASCHVKKADELTAVSSIGTDPGRFEVYHFDVDAKGGGKENALISITHVLKAIVAKAYEQEKLTAAEIKAMRLGRSDEGTWDVKGRRGMLRNPRLTSVWTTAPYLHNGSVPTLDALLRPSNQRPKKFYLGGYDFDPVKVGYETKATAPSAWKFDTSKLGNSNAGHEYGTHLSESDRAALIEYIKTL